MKKRRKNGISRIRRIAMDRAALWRMRRLMLRPW